MRFAFIDWCVFAAYSLLGFHIKPSQWIMFYVFAIKLIIFNRKLDI